MAISHGRPPGNGNGSRHGNGHGNGNGNGHGNGNGNGHEAARSATPREQLFEVVHVVFKRWRLIAGLFLAVVIPGLVVALSSGKRYTAKGKVLIVSDRADVTVQPSEINSLAEIKLNEAVVNSEVHLIRSRELIEEVTRGLRVARTSGGVVGVANASEDYEDIGKRALRLGRRLKVTPIRNSNVIEVAFTSGHQSEAAQIINRVIDEYLAYHARVHSKKGLPDFYEEQTRLLVQHLRRAEEAISEFSYREGIVAPDAEIQAAVGAVSQVEAGLRSKTGLIAGVEEKIRVIREQLAEQPSVVKRTQYLEVNPVVRQLRQNVVNREVDRVSLMRKYTEKNRYVRDNAEEIADLRSRLERAERDEPTVVSQEVFSANPVYEARLNKLLELEAKLKENRARKLSLEEELARGRRQLVQLKQKALEFNRLDQEVKRFETSLELFRKREQEARIGDAMDQERLVNVQVVQRPGLPLPESDSRNTTAMLALISGLVVSLGGAFGLEYVNRTLRFERDVERYLGLPVLATVSDSERT
jgi:uncharacterized protein involved in exopolysaccharide biosynthesis